MNLDEGADVHRAAKPVSDSAEKKKPKRPRGTGCIYKRADSLVWWIKCSRNGKSFSESTHTTSEYKAGKILARRLGEIASSTFLPPAMERIRVDELFDDLLRDYRINNRKSIDDAETRWRLHLHQLLLRYGPRTCVGRTALNAISRAARKKEHQMLRSISR